MLNVEDYTNLIEKLLLNYFLYTDKLKQFFFFLFLYKAKKLNLEVTSSIWIFFFLNALMVYIIKVFFEKK
jgi:hypothetical protein